MTYEPEFGVRPEMTTNVRGEIVFPSVHTGCDDLDSLISNAWNKRYNSRLDMLEHAVKGQPPILNENLPSCNIAPAIPSRARTRRGLIISGVVPFRWCPDQMLYRGKPEMKVIMI